MVKTTGMEEFGFVYVRNQAIVLPRGRVEIAGDERNDFFLLAHEFFHYLSTENPAIAETLVVKRPKLSRTCSSGQHLKRDRLRMLSEGGYSWYSLGNRT